VTAVIIIVAYVFVMLGVGYWCMKRTRTVGDFFLGGRSIGPWMSAFAYGTTYFSAVLFIGYAGKLGWGFGLNTMWIVVGNALVGSLLAWKVLGARTRTMTARLNAMTMPEFLARRYESQGLKVASALLVFVFLVPYSASVYMGLSYLVGGYTHISYGSAVAFMAALTGIYLIMGGYFALTITDFIRGIVELVGVTVMVWYLVSLKGGFVAATSELLKPEHAPALLGGSGGLPGWLTLASLVIVTSLGPWGLPQMVQKFYSIKSETDIKATMVVVTVFALLMAFGAYYTGALTHLFYGAPPANIDELMPNLLTQHVPRGIGLVILLLVFSASMSSLSSLVLVSSSAIAMDLYSGIIDKNASKNRVMLMMRVLCGVFVGASLWMALSKPAFIVNLMVISWGILAGAFAAPYVYGLFWRRSNALGAAAGMVSGVGVCLAVWWILGDPGISPKDPAVPIAGAAGILTPFLIVPIFSLLGKVPSAEVVSRAFKGEGIVDQDY